MKTTLVIDDGVFRRLSIEAAQQGRTISELVEAALRLMLESTPPESSNLQPLPIFDGGGAWVGIANRDALYRLMEE